RHGAKVLDSFSLPNFGDNFSPEQGILDPALRASLEEKIQRVNALVAS
ncbi:MAG: NADPH-dependent FMN reductase, partial [Sphingobacteriia bacterium]|nr:NADPH-dependent FMN reductase [Sphingobacteriia bacterium]